MNTSSKENEEEFINSAMNHSIEKKSSELTKAKKTIKQAEKRIAELDKLFTRLYEDNVAGKIDDARFSKMSKRYEQEQGENTKKIKALRLELKKSEGKRMDIDHFLEAVRRYTNATAITQRVVIHYNCIGVFDVPDRRKIPEADITMRTRKGVAVSYAPAQIAV